VLIWLLAGSKYPISKACFVIWSLTSPLLLHGLDKTGQRR